MNVSSTNTLTAVTTRTRPEPWGHTMVGPFFWGRRGKSIALMVPISKYSQLCVRGPVSHHLPPS